MNHQAEARMQGTAKTEGRLGLHANLSVNIVVPSRVGFGAPPPPREMKVDASKINVKKG